MQQTFQQTPQPRTSPWGQVDDAQEVAPGIWLVSTPSHGGFMLSAERLQAMPAALRCNDYAGARNFEEDGEAALVVAAFPEHFSADDFARAVENIGYTARMIAGWASGPNARPESAAAWARAVEYLARRADVGARLVDGGTS